MPGKYTLKDLAYISLGLTYVTISIDIWYKWRYPINKSNTVEPLFFIPHNSNDVDSTKSHKTTE